MAQLTTYNLELHDWSKPRITLTAPNGQVVFTGNTHAFKPHVTLDAGNQVDAVAANFHSFSSSIDVMYHGADFALTKSSESLFTSSYSFPTAQGETFKWTGGLSNLTCYNSQGMLVARIEKHGWTGKRVTIEVVEGVGEEVLATAVIMFMHHKRQASRQGANASAVSGGAAVAAAGL